MRVLVTGGAGFIGSYVVAAIRAAGHEVVALDVLHLSAHSHRTAPIGVIAGEPHTIAEMAEALSAAFNGPAPVITGQFRAGDVRHVIASPELARAELGFCAEVSFHSGMMEFATAPLRG